jgi:hypothetical protein
VSITRSGMGLLVALVLAAGMLPFRPAQGATRRHWSIGARLLRIEDRTGDPRWAVAAAHAVQGWDGIGADITLHFAGDPSFSGGCTFHDTTVSICRAQLPAGTLALTSIVLDGTGHIAGAFIRVNGYRAMSDGQEQSILCHELGHVVGLDHSPDVGTSCLTTSRTSFPSGPDQRDASILRASYAAQD